MTIPCEYQLMNQNSRQYVVCHARRKPSNEVSVLLDDIHSNKADGNGRATHWEMREWVTSEIQERKCWPASERGRKDAGQGSKETGKLRHRSSRSGKGYHHQHHLQRRDRHPTPCVHTTARYNCTARRRSSRSRALAPVLLRSGKSV